MTPGTVDPRALLWDQDALLLPRVRFCEGSMSPVSDGETTVEGGGGRSASNAATAGRSEVALTSDRPKVPDQPFRLMDLPLELRSMIFRQFLVMPGPVLFRCMAYKQMVPFARAESVGVEDLRRWTYEESLGSFVESEIIRQSSLLNIFSASKTIYRETVPLYFGCNEFDFKSLDYMEQFLSKVGAECRWQIASITINYKGKAPAKAVKRLTECVGLRRLTLHINTHSFGRVDPRTPNEVRLIGMSDLLRIRGLDRIDIVNHAGKYTYFTTKLFTTEDLVDGLREHLEVLKLPRDPKQLKRQERKDFPTKSKRTVFGAANVVTRSEKQLQDTQH